MNQLEPKVFMGSDIYGDSFGQKLKGFSNLTAFGFAADGENEKFSEVDRAGMKYFMPPTPKLNKSSSCPNYKHENDKGATDRQKVAVP